MAIAAVGEYRDVLPGQWYSAGVEYSRKWIFGYGNGEFGVNDPVTRGQLATIIARYDYDKQRVVDHHSDLIHDIAAILCLNPYTFQTLQDDSATSEDALRYKAAVKSLCEVPWQNEKRENTGCSNLVDVENGEIRVVCPVPLPTIPETN